MIVSTPSFGSLGFNFPTATAPSISRGASGMLALPNQPLATFLIGDAGGQNFTPGPDVSGPSSAAPNAPSVSWWDQWSDAVYIGAGTLVAAGLLVVVVKRRRGAKR